jgi:hypothetical protein
MTTRVAMLAAAILAVALSACGDSTHVSRDNEPPPEPPSDVTVVDLGNVSLTATNQDQTFDVIVTGTSSLVIVADGGDATDIDIEQLQTPSGIELITPNRGDANPFTGSVSPQEVGGSVATAIVPSSPAVPLELGTYSFSVASFNAAGTRVPAIVHMTALINHRDASAPGILSIRAFFVGTPGLGAGNAATSPAFQVVFQEFSRTFGRIGIDVELVELVDVGGGTGTRLSLLDVLDDTTDRLVPDVNLNRQSDEMDELFALSAGRTGNAINVFFVEDFFTRSGAVAVSGAAPGPSIVSGTAHSGIAASTLGGLDQQSKSDLEHVGHDLAREVARYLGALGTVDPENFTADQQFALLRNPAIVSALPSVP